jgi:hypothetical protein
MREVGFGRASRVEVPTRPSEALGRWDSDLPVAAGEEQCRDCSGPSDCCRPGRMPGDREPGSFYPIDDALQDILKTTGALILGHSVQVGESP